MFYCVCCTNIVAIAGQVWIKEVSCGTHLGFVIEFFECFIKMEEDQSMYDNVMCEKVYMNDQNEDEGGVNEEHVDCFDAFNISQVLI